MGAGQGLMVTAFNFLAHKESTVVEESPDNGYDKNGNKINSNGGDRTDYKYDDNGKVISSTNVSISTYQGGEVNSNIEGYGYRIRTIGTGGALYDPSFDIAVSQIGGGVVFKGGAYLYKGAKYLSKGKFMFEKVVFRSGGQTTFSIKWMNETKNFMFRFERHNINSPKIGYRTHINLDNFIKKTNAHIYLNPKFWKHTTFK